MEEIMEIDIPDFQWNEYNRHYQNTSIETLDRINVNEADNLKKQFISIGFFLRLTKESGAYKVLGYDTIEAYAYDRMGYSGSRTRRLMQINVMASKDGCSPVLDEQYKAFKSSQLQEMLSMLEDQRQMVTPDMTVRQIKDMKKALARIEIAGYQCTKVDEWTTDGDTYILGNCIDDNSFYYASVGGKDFEFDRKPTREEVESHYIDYLAMQDIDRHEAEVMGFCMSDTEAEGKAAEAAKSQKEREREAEKIATKYAPSDPNELPDDECQGCYLNNNVEYGDMECHPERGEHKCYSGEDEDDEEDCATSHKTDPEKSIDELDLSVYTYNILKRSGIDTIPELQAMSDEELAKLRGMGLRSLNEIKTKLKEYQAVLCDVAQSVADKPESVANAPENVSDQVIDGACIELPEEQPAASEWPDLLSDMPVFARVAVRDYLDDQERELSDYQEAEEADGVKFPKTLMLKKKMAVAGARLLLRLVEGMEADDGEEKE